MSRWVDDLLIHKRPEVELKELNFEELEILVDNIYFDIYRSPREEVMSLE